MQCRESECLPQGCGTKQSQKCPQGCGFDARREFSVCRKVNRKMCRKEAAQNKARIALRFSATFFEHRDVRE